MTDQIITHDGYDKLVKELEFLTKSKRREIADRIEKAKELGDLSENAEYQEAKEQQAFNEGRIAEIKSLLKNLTVVENDIGSDKVGMGSRIVVRAGQTEKNYTIVSFNEVDPMEGKISNESPLGKAFIGKKVGDRVVVTTPKGDIEFEIIDIQ